MKKFSVYGLPAIAGLFLILDHYIVFAVLAYLCIGYYCRTAALKEVGGCYPDGADYFFTTLIWILWPLMFPICCCLRPTLLSPLRFLVSNKFYYLRNPVVLRKLSDEDPNKESTARDGFDRTSHWQEDPDDCPF